MPERVKRTTGGKGEQTRARIIQAALYCLAQYGERDTTFQKIADHCGVSQPLVVHYFKSRENIFRLVLEDFLVRARKKTEDALQLDLSPIEKLRDYFRVSLSLVRDDVLWGRLYLMLYYLSGFNDEYRAVNSEVKRVAVSRVAGILKEGVEQGVFRIKNVDLMAKVVHMQVTGLMLNVLTEKQTFPDNILLKGIEESAIQPLLANPGKK